MSHPKVREHNEATYKVMEELKIQDKAIMTILNKSDKIKDPLVKNRLLKDFNGAISISALSGENIKELIEKITLHIGRFTSLIKVNIPATDMKLLHLIYTYGSVKKRIDKGSAIYIEAQLPQRVIEKLKSASLKS